MPGRNALGVSRSDESPSPPRTDLVLLSEPERESAPPSSRARDSGGSGVRRSPLARSAEAQDDDDRALRESIGKNLRRLRGERTLSYEKLSRVSGVSRAMLNQIELGQSAPTTTLLLKIARALRVTIAALLQADDSPVLHVQRRLEARKVIAASGVFSSRLLSAPSSRGTKLEEFRLQGQGTLAFEAAEPGARRALLIVRGQLRLFFEGSSQRLDVGDSIDVAADIAVSLENPGSEETSGYLVTYAGQK